MATIDTDKSGATAAVERKTGDVYVRLGVNNSMLEGTLWSPLPGVAMVDIAVGRNVIYGITVDGDFVRFGMFPNA